MKRAILAASAVWICLGASAVYSEPVAVGDSDRVVFYGDTVCDPPTFGIMVESFVRAKYPESKARFWHIGTRTYDPIEQANERFDSLVAPLKPTHVVLAWGLGDGGMRALSSSRLEKVKSEYDKLIKRCSSLGAKVYVLTPPKPTIAKKNLLSVAKYDDVVRQVGEAMAEVGKANGAEVLDWYAGCVEMEKSAPPSDMTGKDGVFPAPLSQSVAADLLMRAWRFEPIRVSIEADFKAKTASVSDGSVVVSSPDKASMRLEFSDFPMHFHTGFRDAAFDKRFACAHFCDVRLKVSHLPGSVAQVSDAVQRRRPMSVPTANLAEGLNLAMTSILSANSEANQLIDLILDKNKAWSALLRFERMQLVDRAPEPELLESFKTQLVSRRQYHEGMSKIIARTPRKVDLTLDIRAE